MAPHLQENQPSFTETLFRHSFIGTWFDLRSLQALLGHASLNTTLMYTQLTEVEQQNSRNTMEQLTNELPLEWRTI